MNNKIKTYKVRNTSWENYSLDEYVNWEFKETLLSWYKFIWLENKEDLLQKELDEQINDFFETPTSNQVKDIFLEIQYSKNSEYDKETWLDFDEDNDFEESSDWELETDFNKNEKLWKEYYEDWDVERYNAVLWLNQNWNEIAIINFWWFFDSWEEDSEDSLYKWFKKEWKNLFSTKLEWCTFLFKREDLTEKEIEKLNWKVYNDWWTYMWLTSVINKCYWKRWKSEFQNDNIEIIFKENENWSVKDHKLERYLTLETNDDFKFFTVDSVRLNWKEIEFRTILWEYTV